MMMPERASDSYRLRLAEVEFTVSTINGQRFVRYLSSKKSVDDRALNKYVRETLAAALPKSSPANRLSVLELGAGIGTMIERLVDWKLLTFAEYTAVDSDAVSVGESRRQLARWAAAGGFGFSPRSKNTTLIRTQEGEIWVKFMQTDVYRFLSGENSGRQWDLGIAHAFMDLIDIDDVLRQFCNFIRPGGLLYLTLNYDGETIFLPESNPALDRLILQLYNQSMDERMTDGRKTGGCHTGRNLFGRLQAVDAAVLAAGGSDWIVLPESGGYPADEPYFLHFILDTIHSELKGHPALDQHAFESWIQTRHDQVESAELIFIAKNLDLLLQVSEPR
jgi:SAM-dependent methyltransferase